MPTKRFGSLVEVQGTETERLRASLRVRTAREKLMVVLKLQRVFPPQRIKVEGAGV